MTKEKTFEYINTLINAIFAGISISIGAIAFLSSNNLIIGALFFCVGLFIILNFNFNLYTGKLCYIFSNKPAYSIKLLIIFIGNFIGTNLTAFLLRFTRLISLKEKCTLLASNKLNDSLISLFILAVLCNILIYIAVEGFKSKNIITQYLSLFFGVSVFVLCGFEHSIADMFYFAFAEIYSAKMFLALFIIALGNLVGGNIIELVKKLNK